MTIEDISDELYSIIKQMQEDPMSAEEAEQDMRLSPRTRLYNWTIELMVKINTTRAR